MLNPIVYTEKVVGDFLRYQLTAYPFSDPDLYRQMRTLLNLEATRSTPLFKGPYISLSRTFRQGAKVTDLIDQHLLHPHLRQIAPYPNVYGHQETAIRSITQGKTTLISTGTGSGKTECFLYPVISRCLELRDEEAPAGIVAVIVYPMNALAEDQLGRLRGLLAGTGITFGMYVGKTPETTAQVSGKKLKPGSSQLDYQKALQKALNDKQSQAIHPPEERVSREEMRRSGQQPQILLTNINQLELLLTRQRDVELFDHARLDFLIFDEAHTFTGAQGAETACLIRRLRSFCGKTAADTTCIATSATIVDPERGPEAGREFAARFFGVSQNDVVMVGEEYEPDTWNSSMELPAPPVGDPVIHLKNVLNAVEGGEQAGVLLHSAFYALTGKTIDASSWQESLYEHLARNTLVHQISEAARSPRLLKEYVADLKRRIGRDLSEEETLIWLALGAAARQGNRPLLRPVIHGFIQGVSGAVVTFPPRQDRPKLWLSAEDASGENGDGFYRLPVLTCTTCGQHYFTHEVGDFQYFDREPTGGQAVDDLVIWKPQALGSRVILVDRLITDEDDEEDEGNIPNHTHPIHLCRDCGTLHSHPAPLCHGCGKQHSLLPLLAVRQDRRHPGQLTRCLACQANGRNYAGRYREPARSVRAVAVSDVHVLAQNMIHHAERKRLLVFADNRQDAAFQAGWMQDHARRFRLRSLMYERLRQGPVSIGDLTAYLDDLLDQDDELSRSLAPEVWRVHRKEAEGVKHNDERKRFLRIQVLREVVTGVKQRIGLEPWGRLKVDYGNLHADLSFFTHWSEILGIPPADLCGGVASLLDVTRRGGLLLDREGKIFSRFWQESDFEILRGYMPLMAGIPKGLKLRRDPNDHRNRVQGWLTDRGSTVARQSALHWGIPREMVEVFFDDLWRLLTDELGLLAPAVLTGRRGRHLQGCTGVRQIDGDQLRLTPHQGIYRCNTCRRVNLRPTPNMACMAWRCSGTLSFEEENPDDYDLMVLDQQFTMLRSREHSAQVPATERESLERMFKGDNEVINTLVCTPTLELGVDIGALDSVLMRNVPPLPANYWQRAGRAGRRHRMAVNLTYARQASHDRAYFSDPLKLLQGVVYPPRFNLRNPLMVRKHVHAAILTVLNQLARGHEELTLGDREEIKVALEQCFPIQIKDYLFTEVGYVRQTPLDVGAFGSVVHKHEALILKRIQQIFNQGWPAQDRAVVSEASLKTYVLEAGAYLRGVVQILWKRMNWAMDQMQRLDAVRQQKGTLDVDEEAMRQRCDRLLKKLKGIRSRHRSEAEGYDDTNTFSVLASEGFLPGYGLDVGSIRATAQVPRVLGSWLSDFELPRPPAIALREYIPGNLIYANSNRFIPRFYHLDPQQTPVKLQIDTTHEAVAELGVETNAVGGGLGATTIQAIPICDVDLPHQSHISDEEDYRFQLATTQLGQERQQHGEGKAYTWQHKSLLLRRGVHLRLVNIGVTSLVRSGHELGYPLCLVCGQSRSPLSSPQDREHFAQEHRERCGKPVTPVGFYADVVADTLTLQDCSDRTEAYSLLEALRMGASNVLDMETDDLQILIIGSPGLDQVDALLYDPMPGGSGLLDQILQQWEDVVSAALQGVGQCSSACSTACIDCLFTFRNAYYHRYLDRHLASRRLQEWGSALHFSHDIPAKLPQTSPTQSHELPVNLKEDQLREMLTRAGFPDPICQHPIDLGKPLGMTTPDFFYEDDRFEGICIYLDGMSRHIHGNPETQQRDQAIREELRNQGYEVLKITATDLDDVEAVRKLFRRLGQILLGKQRAQQISDSPDWFVPLSMIHQSDLSRLDLDELLDLLEPQWHDLISSLFQEEGILIDAGEDIIQNQQVIGFYTVAISNNGQQLRLLDSTQSNDPDLLSALQDQGYRALVIDPTNPEEREHILKALRDQR